MNLNYFDSLPDESAPLTSNVTTPLVYGVQTTPHMSYNFYSTNNVLVSNTADITASTNACQASSTTRTPSQLYMIEGANVLTSHITTPQVTVGVRPFETSADGLFLDVKKCHLHTKPQLTCKFCRKFKSSIHQHARLAQQQQQQEGRWTELQDLESTVWATIEITNQTTYNVSTLLRENILASEYFKSLYGLQTFKEVVDEIFNYADHAEPYCAGSTRAPSTLFCCLYKLFTMRLKEHEVQALLDHTDSPYLRCCGFLYLRFVLPPEKLWDWLSPYFLDDEVFSPGTDKTRTTTIGEYVETLITEDRYFSIVLPRIPVKIKAQDGAQLITMPSHRKRKALNKSKIDQFKPNTPVAACSNFNGALLQHVAMVFSASTLFITNKEKHFFFKSSYHKKTYFLCATPAYLLATRGRVLSIDGAESGQCSCLVQLDDDVVDLVDLGLVIILDAKQRALKRREERRLKRLSRGLPLFVKKKKKKTHASPLQTHHTILSEKSKDTTYHSTHPKRHRHDHGVTSSRSRPADSRHRTFRSSSPSRNRHSSTSGGTFLNAQSNMIEEFRKRERAKALAFGKDYARRPTSYKSSLSLRFENFSGRKRTQLPPQVFKDAPAPNLSRVEPSREEVKKKEEPSLDYQKRMAQLVERYSKMHD